MQSISIKDYLGKEKKIQNGLISHFNLEEELKSKFNQLSHKKIF